jgi:hypothetical protein
MISYPVENMEWSELVAEDLSTDVQMGELLHSVSSMRSCVSSMRSIRSFDRSMLNNPHPFTLYAFAG